MKSSDNPKDKFVALMDGLQEALKEKHLGLIKKRKALARIMDRLRSIIKVFNWE